MRVTLVKLIGVYSDPKRDIKRGTIAVAFIAKPLSDKIRGDFEVEEVKWFKLDELPRLGFDHRKIVDDARRML